jgi:hypothetical protein
LQSLRVFLFLEVATVCHNKPVQGAYKVDAIPSVQLPYLHQFASNYLILQAQDFIFKMLFVTVISAALALPTALAAPTAKTDSEVANNLSNKHISKRDCFQQNFSGSIQVPTVPDSDVRGLINTINGMGGWDTLVPLPQWGGTFRQTYGSVMLCITNQYMFCNTHLSVGEASWVTSWIAYSQCNLNSNPNSL